MLECVKNFDIPDRTRVPLCPPLPVLVNGKSCFRVVIPVTRFSLSVATSNESLVVKSGRKDCNWSKVSKYNTIIHYVYIEYTLLLFDQFNN